MACKGIFITDDAVASLFNYELILNRGSSLIERNDFGGDPEILRAAVERGLRMTAPRVHVGFWDPYSEQPIENPEGHDYSLLIENRDPIRSASMH